MTLQNVVKISIQTTQTGVEIPVPIQVAKAIFWLLATQSIWWLLVLPVNLYESAIVTLGQAKIYCDIFMISLASALFGLVNPQRSVLI